MSDISNNKLFAKENVLLQSVIQILIQDNTNTNAEIREIHHYVADRIFRSFVDKKKENPQIVIAIQDNGDSVSLPTGSYIVMITAFVPMSHPFAPDVLSNLTARISYLLNKNEDNLNNIVPSKHLRCRRMLKFSLVDNNDYLDLEIYGKNILFDVVCDYENL